MPPVSSDSESLPPTIHVPVMVAEVLDALSPAPGQAILDGTLGGGGHARAIAERLVPGGRLIGVDRDPSAIERAAHRLGALPVESFHAAYDEVEDRGLVRPASLDGILLDLGLSSDQLADRNRGFSFDAAGPLDLRFDPTAGTPAWQFLDQIAERDLANLIYKFGEERFSRRIARRIVEARRRRTIRTAAELAAIVRRAVRRSRGHSIDPATRTFQALRIAVNQELEGLQRVLAQLPGWLKPGGRVAIITFHSLEDRLVKHAFRNDPRLEVLTRKPVRPTEEERRTNPPSRSAKLRVAARTSAAGAPTASNE